MQIIRIVAIVAALVLGGIAGSSTSVRAQGAPDPAALRTAEELAALVSKGTIRELATQITAQVWPQITQGLRAKQTISADQLSDLRKEFERIQVEFLVKVMASAPTIYARHFTAAELRELLAFYRSPIGEKSLRVMPQIAAETMALIMPQMQQLQTQVMEAFGKVLKQRGFTI